MSKVITNITSIGSQHAIDDSRKGLECNNSKTVVNGVLRGNKMCRSCNTAFISIKKANAKKYCGDKNDPESCAYKNTHSSFRKVIYKFSLRAVGRRTI